MSLELDPLTQPSVTLRPASGGDIEVMATIWHDGWRDGHLGHVPAGLEEHRRLADFRQRVPALLGSTTVAVVDGRVVGFVVVREDEIEQIYVVRGARGTGVATALLAQGESLIRDRFDRAWLAVVAGNRRARRFYERQGWTDAGAIDYRAATAGDLTIPVPSRRYEKQLTEGAPAAAR